MDAATSSTPPPASADTVNASPHSARDHSPHSPERPSTAIVAQRRIMKAGGVGSPVRRSPRLSRIPPLQPPVEVQDTHDPNENSDDESEIAHVVALLPSREDTPENDDLPADEPSTILASRIMRAHDNPSPPPQDLAHPGTNYVPGKDGQFPLPGASVLPSPFRPINLLERLNQLSNPSSVPPCSPKTPNLGARPDISGSGIMTPRGFISPESSSPYIASMAMRITPHKGLATDTIPASSTQYTVDISPRLSQHSVTDTTSLDSKFLSVDLPQAGDSSSNLTMPPSDNYSRDLGTEGQSSGSRSSPLPLDAKALLPPTVDKSGESSQCDKSLVPGEQGNRGEDIRPFSKEEQESKSEPIATEKVNVSSLERPDSLHSTDVLAKLRTPTEPTSSIEQKHLTTESIRSEQLSATPPRTPVPFAIHPNVSRTSVQRPVVAPTPVRANSVRKLNSSTMFSFEIDDIHRTPAQRVPIETVLTRGTPSFQKTAQLSTGTSHSRSGPSLTIRAPVFSRPALDDPSRSPAKRVPITNLKASPSREYQGQSSPIRLGHRARSTPAEPRPLGINLARGRSVEPYVTLRPNDHAKAKECVFPMAPTLPSTVAKLPFPLVPGKNSSSDLPLPILEERESTEEGNTETNTSPGKASGKTTSQLKQPSASSRIPRIGSKPYVRPQKTGKVTVSTATTSTARTPRAPPFQLACKNNRIGNGNLEGSSSQPTNDQRLVGSLKRKRGADATAPPNSHPVMIRKVVPGILSKKHPNLSSQVQAPPEASPPKAPQPLRFRKVVDGMSSVRKANRAQAMDASLPPSPLSDLSSSSNEGSSDEKSPPAPPTQLQSETSATPLAAVDSSAAGLGTHEPSLDEDTDRPSGRPRRTSRTRKPAQQQYVFDVFDANTSTRPPPARRKPPPRTEADYFMGMSATALKSLTTSNTTKNQQTLAVLATEVIRKEGLRPESPTVKARTILQKQRDERDMRRQERARKRGRMSEEGLGGDDAEGSADLSDRISPSPGVDRDENDSAVPRKHRRGPGDEEDFETPERPERIIEPLRLEGMDRQVKPSKQVKWHRGLSTAVYLDEIDPKPKALSKNVVMRGCLAPTSKNLPLDSLGNLVDLDKRPLPELIAEHIIVKKFLYDNDIEPEPIPTKVTRSKGKKG